MRLGDLSGRRSGGDSHDGSAGGRPQEGIVKRRASVIADHGDVSDSTFLEDRPRGKKIRHDRTLIRSSQFRARSERVLFDPFAFESSELSRTGRGGMKAEDHREEPR